VSSHRLTKNSGRKQTKTSVRTRARTPQPTQSAQSAPNHQTALPAEMSAISLDSQVAMLKRLPAGQSQATLMHISRRQGNRHVQRLMAAMGSGSRYAIQRQDEDPCPNCPDEESDIQRTTVGGIQDHLRGVQAGETTQDPVEQAGGSQTQTDQSATSAQSANSQTVAEPSGIANQPGINKPAMGILGAENTTAAHAPGVATRNGNESVETKGEGHQAKIGSNKPQK